MKRTFFLFVLFFTLFSQAFSYEFLSGEFNFKIISMQEKTCEICQRVGHYYSGDIEIPSSVEFRDEDFTVTKVGGSAFALSNITSVKIPSSVTIIEYSAFSYCDELTSVIIPNSVVEIQDGAFVGCSSLDSVVIPNSVKTIGNSVFSGCSSLRSISIPNSVTSIGDFVFAQTGLTSIVIPESYDTINGGMFSDCHRLTTLTIPNSVVSIEEGAFSGCDSLLFVTIPSSVRSIDELAFNDCNNLRSITIEGKDLSIAESAFGYDSDNGNYISVRPDKVIWLADTPPVGCEYVRGKCNYVPNNSYSNLGLSNVYVYPFLTSLFEVDGVRCVPVSLTDHTCDVIDCTYDRQRMKIGSSVNVLGKDMKIRKLGPYVSSGNAQLKDLQMVGFRGSISDSAFYSCRNLEDVVISKTVDSIGNGAFARCTALARIEVQAIKPIVCGLESFYKVNRERCVLSVPSVSVDEYSVVSPWNEFLLIEGTATAIRDILQDGNTSSLNCVLNGPVIVYSLRGDRLRQVMRVSSLAEALEGLPAGVYVLRGGGASCKVVKP